MAVRNERSLTFDGLLMPLIFRTNWSEAALISYSVTGGSKLKRVLMLRHIPMPNVSELEFFDHCIRRSIGWKPTLVNCKRHPRMSQAPRGPCRE
jgi:hypothetical protein